MSSDFAAHVNTLNHAAVAPQKEERLMLSHRRSFGTLWGFGFSLAAPENDAASLICATQGYFSWKKNKKNPFTLKLKTVAAAGEGETGGGRKQRNKKSR